MSLRLRGNINATGFLESAPLVLGEFDTSWWFAVDVHAPAPAVSQQLFIEWLGRVNIRVTNAGDIEARIQHGDGTKSLRVNLGNTSAGRIRILIVADSSSGTNGQVWYYANGVLIGGAPQDIATGKTLNTTGGTIDLNGYNEDGMDPAFHGVYCGVGTVPTLADAGLLNDGVVPEAGQWSVDANRVYKFIGTGYSASIAADVGGTTLNQTDIIAGETDSGSANAPELFALSPLSVPVFVKTGSGSEVQFDVSVADPGGTIYFMTTTALRTPLASEIVTEAGNSPGPYAAADVQHASSDATVPSGIFPVYVQVSADIELYFHIVYDPLNDGVYTDVQTVAFTAEQPGFSGQIFTAPNVPLANASNITMEAIVPAGGTQSRNDVTTDAQGNFTCRLAVTVGDQRRVAIHIGTQSLCPLMTAVDLGE